jgi:hypothetical protein
VPDPVSLQPSVLHERHYTFGPPISFLGDPGRADLPVGQDARQRVPAGYERIYPCPANLSLEPFSAYRIAGWTRNGGKNTALFEFVFNTDDEGKPAAY